MSAPTTLGVVPELSGATPFPNLGDWIADAALFAQQSLQRRAGDDLAGRERCRRLMSLGPEDWTEAALHPALFAFLTQGEALMSWEELGAYLDAPRPAGRPAFLRDSPGTHFDGLLRALGPGSRRRSCDDAAFLTDAAEEHAKFVALGRAALEAVAAFKPGFAEEMLVLVPWIGFVSDASFRGASGVALRGLALFCPDDSWTAGTFAEEFVHETTHCLLDVVSIREPLLSGEDAFAEVHAAPFRPDKRHLFGNFHALVVVARLLLLFEAFGDAGFEPATDWQARASDYATRSLPALEAVDAYPGLSPVARLLLDRLVVPVLERGAS